MRIVSPDASTARLQLAAAAAHRKVDFAKHQGKLQGEQQELQGQANDQQGIVDGLSKKVQDLQSSINTTRRGYSTWLCLKLRGCFDIVCATSILICGVDWIGG